MAKRASGANRIKILIDLEMPPDADADDVLAYVGEAVGTWRGQLRPPGGYGDDDQGDPMWDLKSDTITVALVTKQIVDELALDYGKRGKRP